MKNNEQLSIVWAKLPNMGLGNKMLVWARAYTFAFRHNLPFYVTNWVSISLGTFLRWERSKRLYFGYFKPLSLISKWRFKKKIRNFPIVIEPTQFLPEPYVYRFEALFISNDYFQEMKPYRQIVKSGFKASLKESYRKRYNNLSTPTIGIHIRRGDFKLGSTLTPIDFFISVIKFIRNTTLKQLPVTIFSDASDSELSAIIELQDVTRAKPQPDILDLLQLSKSEIVVMSISSTFSFWSAFLSEGIVIKHKDEWHPPILPLEMDGIQREFVFNDDQESNSELAWLLKENFLKSNWN
jgi:hypothetical protein